MRWRRVDALRDHPVDRRRRPISSSSCPRASSRARTPARSSASPRRRRTSRSQAWPSTQHAVAKIIKDDPNVADVNASIGAVGFEPGAQHRPPVHPVEAARRAQAHRRRGDPGAAAQDGAGPRHQHLFPEPAEHPSRRPAGEERLSVHAPGQRHGRALPLRARSCRTASPSCRASRTSTPTCSSTTAWPSSTSTATRRRSSASRSTRCATTFYSAFGARADLDHLRAVERATRSSSRSTSATSRRRPTCRRSICESATGAGRAACRRWRRSRTGVGPVTVNHQGQLPSVTISFNLAPGVSLGTAVSEIAAARAHGQPAGHGRDRLPGQRPGLPGRAQGPGPAADRRGARHLHRARHSLRELHPPDHDPVGPAGGRRSARWRRSCCSTRI